jgi:hypothetical protein
MTVRRGSGILRPMARIGAVLVIALTVAAAATATTGRPELRLVTMQPFVVKGTHFLPHERVRVTITAAGVGRTGRTRTNAAGAFTISFDVPPLGRCAGVFGRAVGTRGSVATLKRPPLPACMPVRTP